MAIVAHLDKSNHVLIIIILKNAQVKFAGNFVDRGQVCEASTYVLETQTGIDFLLLR